MKTILKAAAASFAFFAMTGAAFAEDMMENGHLMNNGAVLQNIYAAMEANRTTVFELVLASAEQRLEARMADLETNTNEPALSFMVAAN